MMMISRPITVPTSTARRVTPAAATASSDDRPAQQERALVLVPTPRDQKPRAKTTKRARNAAPEVVVQIIAGPQRRGLKAERSEVNRYRQAYALAATPRTAAPRMERRA